MTRIPLSREDLMRAISDGIARGIWDIATNGSDRIDLPNELLFHAIRQGTADAIWRVATNATQMPCADFYDSIKAGIADAIEKLAP